MSLRIAIDASRTTVPRLTGTEHYSRELIRALIALNQKHQLTLYFRDAPPDDLFPPSEYVTYKVIPFKRLWTHVRFAAAILRDKPDLTFVPAHTLPLLFPGKAIVTVHDLGYKHFPQAHTGFQRWYLDYSTRHSARRANMVFVDSQATADDLTHFYGTNKKKIQVVYPGVEAPEYNDVDVFQKYNLPPRYFLFIGTLQPRKNIEGIVRAYRAYRERVEKPAGLVLAGGKGWLYDERWTVGVEGVHLPGYIDEEDKAHLYANAVALVFPSFYEGFGFPVVEALHIGLPAIISNTSSLPEIAGDAALQVDPNDSFQIAIAMMRVETDYTLREDLREAGYKRVRQFQWERAARRVLAYFEHVANQKA